MPTQDFKPRIQVTISPVYAIKVFCLFIVLLTTAVTVFSATSILIKSGLLIFLFISCLPLKNYIAMLDRVSELRIEGENVFVKFAEVICPVEICASPVVTSWLIIIPFRQSALQKDNVINSLLKELYEWFYLPHDKPPQFINLCIVPQSCSLASQAQLRAYLLTYKTRLSKGDS